MLVHFSHICEDLLCILNFICIEYLFSVILLGGSLCHWKDKKDGFCFLIQCVSLCLLREELRPLLVFSCFWKMCVPVMLTFLLFFPRPLFSCLDIYLSLWSLGVFIALLSPYTFHFPLCRAALAVIHPFSLLLSWKGFFCCVPHKR